MATDPILYTFMDSPLGKILIARNSAGLICTNFQEGLNHKTPDTDWCFNQVAFAEVMDQLQAYFNSELYQFNLPLAPQGTPLQQQVWRALLMIPYGETISYSELAWRFLCRPHMARAVGAACSQNPLPIVIPCHRVVGSNGAPTGYAGGVHLKQALLTLEREARSKINLQHMFTEFQTNII
jgi:methylated-DNA-[protein]-cysteine S-methyltransferase